MKRINFETAILAKKAGYDKSDIWWANYYTDFPIQKWKRIQAINKQQGFDNMEFPAPYQAELQEWLIREYGIYVIVAPRFYGDDSVWHVNEVIDISNNTLDTLNSNLFQGIFSMYVTYEDALEEGLLQALKIVIDAK